MSLYAEMQAAAAGLLKELRQGVVTLSRTTTADPEPETPWIPGAPATATWPLDATVRGAGAEHIDGTLILASDLVVTTAAPPVVPALDDVIVIDGREHAIKKIEPVPAAGTPVVYRIFVAR